MNKKKTKKRKRNSSDDDSSSSESSSSSDEEKLKEKYDVEDGLRAEQKTEAEKDRQEATKAKQGPQSPKLDEDEGNENTEPKGLDSKINTYEEIDNTLKSPEISSNPIKNTDNGDGSKVEEDGEKPSVGKDKVVETETIDLDKVKDGQPRALHRTSSIFLRNLAPSITRSEIEAVCNRFPAT